MELQHLLKTAICAFLCLLLLKANAQTVQITGKVTDSEKNTPLPGATVKLKNANSGVITDVNGEFKLNAPKAAATLITVSLVGYSPQELSWQPGKTLNIKLRLNTTSLDEVVVVSVGYGTLNKKEVSSAITHVSGKELLTVGGNGALMSLQGKVAGLSITNTATADPNSSPSIQLRGVSSRDAGLGPLYVINGVPGGNIDNLNQNDIESIDVLKGGAASAIYGTRGSNGVIVITTKKGTSTARLFYDGYTGFDYATNKLKVLDRATFLKNERGTDFGANTDWLKSITRDPAYSQKHTLQFSGGSAQTNYLASVDFRNANGIDLRSSKKEYGGRISVNHTSADNKYVATFSIAPRYAHTNLADYGNFPNALTLNPTIPIRDSSGKYTYITSAFYSSNPVEIAKTILNQQDIKYLDMNGSFRVNVLPNLNTQVTVGEVSSSFRAYGFTPTTLSSVRPQNGGSGRNSANQALDENDQKSFEWTGNYSLRVKKHSLKLLGGYSYQLFTSSGFSASNQDFPSDVLTFNNLGSGLWNLEKGQNNVASYKNSSTLIAFFGRLNYDFDQKYYLSASLRREGSSKFGINNKWGYFPAASFAWRMTEENFLKNVPWLNDLKLRADYGETGNQDFGSYLSLATYSGYGYYLLNGTNYQVWGPSQNTNYDLHWEKAMNTNVGLDFEVLDHRISGSINYYIRTNKDLLGNYAVPNPPNIQGTTYANVGTMRNSGFELQLSGAVLRSGAFRYNINFAGATNSNKFVSFSNALYKGTTYIDVVNMPAPGSPGNIQRLQEGKRIGSFYTLKSAGVDENGTLLVYNKDGQVITADKANYDDKRFVGSGLPKFTASLGNTLSYKKWDLSVYLRGAFGYQIFNTNAFYLGTPATQTNVNLLKSAYDGGKYSKLKDPKTIAVLSDYFLEQADYVKIDNVSLGYTQKVNSSYIHSFRVYATGRNLHTFTKYTGGDPELVQTNGLYPGVNSSLAYYPSTIQLLLGVQVNF